MEWSNYSVLIAEDEEINYLYVSEILKSSGIKVIRALNGQEALDVYTQNPTDLILMDIKMPVMDGITATKKLRDMGVKVPIIALTAYAMNEDRTEAINAGCNEYLTKPFHKSNLLELVSYYLNEVT
jgi:CheY-like chemotaxis protein